MKNPARRLTSLRLSGLALAIALAHAPARALDYTWMGGGGFWDDASRWTLLGVPGSGDTATINKLGDTSPVLLRDPRSVGTFNLNGGTLTLSSVLSAGAFNFGSGTVGTAATPDGGVINVAGETVFNGGFNQNLLYSQVLNLGTRTTWTQGNGRLAVDLAYTAGNAAFASAQLNITAGGTFTDEGAASDTSFKVLGGGAVNNRGTYVRTGLGTTYVRGFNNEGLLDVRDGDFVFDTGNWHNSSSGTILVASGSTLGLAAVDFTAGNIVNHGLVRQIGNDVTLGAAVQIGGAWQLDAGTMRVQGTHAVDSLVMNGFMLTGPGTLTTGTLVFNGGHMGGTAGTLGGGTLNVTGQATFNGASNVYLDYNHTLNLNGNARWTAGNGIFGVQAGGSAGPDAQLNIVAGTTFTDEGAASATSYKVLGGAGVNNRGTYVRTGLGTTYARGFNNEGTLDVQAGDFIFDTGNWHNTSSGTILVASGSTLGLAAVDFTGGSIVNQGLVRQIGNEVNLGAGVQISGAWQLDAGTLRVQGTHAIASLVMNGFLLTGPGTLTTGSFTFNGGNLGGNAGALGGGTLNVTGPATFNGASNLNVNYNHTVNLDGDARWTAGNGRLIVQAGGSAGPDARLNIGAGTTFTDEGAATAAGYKTLGGRWVSNAGTYVRTGLGETYAQGFLNTGVLQVAQGSFSVDANFSNTGRVDVAAGAMLFTYSGQFANQGTLTGSGVVKTLNANSALASSGVIDPGQAGTAGTLTIDGDLTLATSAVLHIDLFSSGADRLVVTSDALLRGELSVWGGDGLSLQLGDVFTVASFSQRVSNSTFSSVSWHGMGANEFAVEYTANSVLLRVTAVPEPASYALWAVGLGLAAVLKRRRRA